jgi:hypothetical protein
LQKKAPKPLKNKRRRTMLPRVLADKRRAGYSAP